jgi:hypothetical protein
MPSNHSPPSSQPVSIHVSTSNYKSFFQKWNKNTSTLPSGKHLGHYKALLAPDLVQDSPLTNPADKIITLKIKLCQFTLAHEHIWNRWKGIVSVMIEKKPGLFLMEKLCTIHLFEADYNWTLGLIFRRRMVHDAEKQDHLNESQWGSHPGRSTEEALIHKKLSYEISCITRTPLGTFDNDTKAYYNHIVMLFALIVCQKHGVSLSACKLSAKALLSAKFSIKTEFGISGRTHLPLTNQLTGRAKAAAKHLPSICLLDGG